MYCFLLLLLLNFRCKLRMHPDSAGLLTYQYINKLKPSFVRSFSRSPDLTHIKRLFSIYAMYTTFAICTLCQMLVSTRVGSIHFFSNFEIQIH